MTVSPSGSSALFATSCAFSVDRLDVLVHNAAIGYDTWEGASDADLVGAQRIFDTNVFGAWRLTQALLPKLRRSPHARIVNVSSGAGSLASMGAGAPANATSKAALNALTRVLAAELRRDGILVNAVCPGWSPPTWAARAGAGSEMERPPSSGRQPSRTTARPAASSATDDP